MKRILKHYSVREFEKQMEKLNAECADCIEGCLIDNVLYWSGDYFIIAKETYVNCCCSDYTVYITDEEDVINQWYNDFEELRTDRDE